MIPLAINTADNTAITADTLNFTADGADLTNGGSVELVIPKALSRTVSAYVNLFQSPLSPLPVLYPAQTFYVNGVAVTL